MVIRLLSFLLARVSIVRMLVWCELACCSVVWALGDSVLTPP